MILITIYKFSDCGMIRYWDISQCNGLNIFYKGVDVSTYSYEDLSIDFLLYYYHALVSDLKVSDLKANEILLINTLTECLFSDIL